MSRITIDAGDWEQQLPPPPPPVQYVVEVNGGRVLLTALHGSAFDRRQTCAHAMGLKPDEALKLGRALVVAGLEAKTP